MEHIVRVWLGHEYLEYEIEVPDHWTEDEVYEAAADDVLSNISIEVI